MTLNLVEKLVNRIDEEPEIVNIQIKLRDILNTYLDDDKRDDWVREYDNKIEWVIYTQLEKDHKSETQKVLNELIERLKQK